MAKKAGLGQSLFQGNFDISGDTSTISSWSTPVGMLDVTGIDKSAFERIQGVSGAEISYNVFFNDSAGAAHLASRVPSTATNLTWALGSSVGDAAGMVAAITSSYDPTRAADGMLTFDIEAVGNATYPVWGVMLTSGSDTHTEATNGTTVDQGAQTTAGAEAILHVTSFTGSNFTATVQDSSNGSSWGTLKAFTQVTGVGNERVTVSGTVERYVRVISAGTFNPVTFAVSFRRGEATDRVTYS